MPIYEYRCRSCGHRFETLHARMDEPAPACPGCGGSDPEKLFSAFAVARESRPASGGGGGGCCCGDGACRME